MTDFQKYRQDKQAIEVKYQAYLAEHPSKSTLLTDEERKLIHESFMLSLAKLIREIAKWQKIGDLRPIGWISLMFIRKSIQTKDYEFRWDLYDRERALFRFAPLFYWMPKEYFAKLEKEYEEFIAFSGFVPEEMAEEKIILIKETIIAGYFEVLEPICKAAMTELRKYSVWELFQKSDNLKVSFEHFHYTDCLLYAYDHSAVVDKNKVLHQ